ncbi:MAG: four helix bundle protein, partial [Kiritimatiellae bacterium]|nr:four helix bundle protein [Kiritimatiellia bacterium]
FEDLEAWRKSRALVGGVYSLTNKNCICKDFGLSNQLQRASVSIMSNIAEGFERAGCPEKVQFYRISRASCGEVRSLLYVVEDVYPEYSERAQGLREMSSEVGQVISGLIRSTQKRMAFITLNVLIALSIFFILTISIL